MPGPMDREYDLPGGVMHAACRTQVDATAWTEIKRSWIERAAEWLYKTETQATHEAFNFLLDIQALGERPRRHGTQKSTKTWAEMDAMDRLPYMIEATNQWRLKKRGRWERG